MLLQFRELGGLVAGRGFAAFTRRTFAALAFAEDFVEGPDFGEEHVARRAAHLAVRSDVVRPDVPRDELVRLDLEFLQLEQVAEVLLFIRGGVGAEEKRLRLASGHRVGQAVIAQTEVIPSLGIEGDFLKRRHFLIAARREQLQVGRTILQRIEDELRRKLVRAAIGIDELQFVGRAVGQHERRERGERLV